MSVRSPSRPPRPLPRRRAAVLESLEARQLLATVTVNTDQAYQTIEGLGGNYAIGRKVGSPTVNDAVGLYTLNNLSVAHARVGVPLRTWEPVNDNNDADTANAGGFVNSGDTRNVFLLMQDLHARGIPISLAIWDAPDWMVSNPTWPEDRVVAPAMYEELSESIEQFLVTARDVYGVPVETIAFNEADLGYYFLFTAQEHANFIKTAGPRIESHGLPTKWLVGDTAQVAGLYNYAKAILEDADARPYLAAVSYHSWTALTATDAQFTRIYDLANQYGKAVWCTELGYDSALHFNPPIFRTWEYGIKTARTYHRVLKQSRASVIHYWEYQNDYPLVNPSTMTPNPAFYVVKELAEGLRPGAQVVSADSDEPTLMALAGKHVADETFMLQLVNTSTSSEQVSINGLPSSALTLIRSSATQNGATVGTYNPVNGILTLTLPAESVSTLRGRLGVPSPWQGRDVGAVGIAGRESYDGGIYTLHGSGNGFSGSNDAFHFVHQPADGNASVIAHVLDRGDLSSSAPPSSVEAGVMIRDGVGPAARFAALVLTGSRAYFRYRDATGAESVEGGHENGVNGDVLGPPYPRGQPLHRVDLLQRQQLDRRRLGNDRDAGGDAGRAGRHERRRRGPVVLQLRPGQRDRVARHARAQPAGGDAGVAHADRPLVARQRGQRRRLRGRALGRRRQFHALATVPTNIPRYSDTTATPGTEYWYRVRAANEVGRSAFSLVARVKTPQYYEAETATRSNNGIRFHNGFANYTGTGYVDFQTSNGWVQWTIDVPFDGGYALDFRYAQGATSVPTLQIDVDGATAASALTFPSTTSYNTWSVRTLNVQLTAGTHTVRAQATSTFPDLVNIDALHVRPQVAPAPANFVAKAVHGQVVLSWTDSPLSTDTYRIERSLDGITFSEYATTGANATTWTDPAAELLVPYFYQVRATNPAGDSRYTPMGVVTVPTLPADPTSFTATAAGPIRVDLAWQDVSDNEDGFRVERSTNGTSWTTLTTTAPDVTSYATFVAPNTHYYFRVRATNGAGDSAEAAAEVVTPAVTVFAASPGAGYSFGGTTASPVLTVFSGTVTFTADAANEFANLGIITQTGAHVTFDATQHLASLIVGADSTASMPPGANRFLHTRALAINATGRFDMTDNDLIFDYSGTTPYTTVHNFVINGRNNAGGLGGIVSAGDGTSVLAVVDNAVWGKSTFNGVNIDSSTIVGKFTYFGDANLDGKVSGDDYVSVDANLGTRRPWFHGDFNFSGTVTGDDYVAIDANLGKGTTDPSALAEMRAEMITIHAARYGKAAYVKLVEQAAKGRYKVGPKTPAATK